MANRNHKDVAAKKNMNGEQETLITGELFLEI